MLFNFGWGNRARVFGIDVFGDHDGKWWYDYGVWPLYITGRKVRDGIWWLRYRLDRRHRYHLIDTHLKPRYYDIDHIMLHGMFSLLRRYVEEEHEGVEALEKWGRELIDRADTGFTKESDERQGSKELEAVALYRWWMETLPAMLKRDRELMDLLYGGKDRITWADAGKVDGETVSQMIFRPDEVHEKEWRREHKELEERIDREEQEMLHRLIDIRRSLWT